MASKRKPGASVPEAQRHTEQVKLRLPPDVAAELRRRAVGHPGGASGVVAMLLEESAEARRIILEAAFRARGIEPGEILTELVRWAEADDAMVAAGMKTGL